MAKKEDLGKNLAAGGISRIKTKKKLIDTSLEDTDDNPPIIPDSVLKPKHVGKKKKYRDGEEVKAVNIEFPVTLWEKIKLRAFKEHYTFKGVMLRAAQFYIAAKEKEEEEQNREK